MTDVANSDEDICAIYIDTGTTNTRGWLMRGDEILRRGCKPVGVRDTARDQSPAKLHAALKELIGELQLGTGSFETPAPACVAAAGMISSPLGLAEVPHVAAPVSAVEIATASRVFSFHEVTEFPILLVPGVRSGVPDASCDSIDNVDVMRGEETLCFGLLQRGLVNAPAVVLTLGSHWKAIRIDSDGRIASSITSLSGELIHAARTQTILASSVGAVWPDHTSPDWLEAGANAQRRSGLSRALFSVRLLELKGDGSPEDRLSYLLGAFIAADLDALVAREVIVPDTQVVISGHALIAEAWASALSRISVTPRVLSESETETAFLAGLRSILRIRNQGMVSACCQSNAALPSSVR
jgi:2-dehydro-3-deoxygalactonokinase